MTIMVKSTTNKGIFYKKIRKCNVEMTPPLKICKSKPKHPPRMLTYATTKSILWAILGLNKQGTHFASFGLHLLFVGIGKGKQSINVCQCGNLFE